MNPVFGGAALVLIYTGLISGADAITKLIAGQYAAAQLYCLSGLVVACLCVLSGGRDATRTTAPRAMALRSVATVLAAICFFYGFRHLPMADMFLFIGLMPILAGLMSGAILREPVRATAWAALIVGVGGVFCLFPNGLHSLGPGHAFGLAASVFGTFSMVMARFIARHEANSLAQVFFPSLALCLSMAAVAPWVWQPMPAQDALHVLLYAGLLFAARWVVVLALRRMPAYAVTPLMNMQFVWMAILGAVVFGELPAFNTVIGATIVIASGLVLIWDQISPLAVPRTAEPARSPS